MYRIEVEKLEFAAEMLKSVAHPIRLKIINLLIDYEKKTVTEIHKILNIEQAATSHHLGILKNKGILGSERDGKNCYYYLKQKKISAIIQCIKECSL
ncbi:MAG: ArsR/SmtB family transcription factor [Bacteroidota bacterium]